MIKKIAMFLSGRINCFETDLFPNLIYFSKDPTISIDLFCSVNGEPNEYFSQAEELLSPWLKNIQYEVYKIPENNYINDKNPAVYNLLSCFYNDKKAYNMIEEYAKKNNIEYTYICKFRADIKFKEGELFKFPEKERDTIVWSCVAPDPIYFHGNKIFPMMIANDFIFSSPLTMKHYCGTYDFILRKLIETEGKFTPWFEHSVMENFYDITTPWVVTTDENLRETFRIFQEAYLKSKYEVRYFRCDYEYNKRRTQTRTERVIL
jgi:hypothetical protein